MSRPGGESHFAVVVRIPDFDQQARAHELVQDIVHDAGGQRESAAEFIDRERPFVFPKAVYDLEHDGQDDPASSVVADAERFALFGETVDILVANESSPPKSRISHEICSHNRKSGRLRNCRKSRCRSHPSP